MSMIYRALPFAVSAFLGYFLGCPNPAWLISRLKGVDLRARGTKNLGTANTFITLGPVWGIFVFLFDTGKAALAVALCRSLYPETELAGLTAGAAAVFGHVFPVWLRFHGGRGLASYLGMIFATDWRVGLIFLAGIAVVTVITDYLIVASTLTVIAFPVWTGFAYRGAGAVGIVLTASLLYLILHRANWIRLIHGREMNFRSGGKRIRADKRQKKVSSEEKILYNRENDL